MTWEMILQVYIVRISCLCCNQTTCCNPQQNNTRAGARIVHSAMGSLLQGETQRTLCTKAHKLGALNVLDNPSFR